MQNRIINANLEKELSDLINNVQKINYKKLNNERDDFCKKVNEYIKQKKFDEINPLFGPSQNILKNFSGKISFIYSLIQIQSKKTTNFEKAEAFIDLGTNYISGIGTKKDLKQSKICYEEARRIFLQESATVATWEYLGRIYEFGLGTGIDLDEAFKWYKRFDEFRDDEANAAVYRETRAIVARVYIKQKNYKLAFENLKLALSEESPSSLAQYQMGYLFQYGLGVPARNSQIACAYYDKVLQKEEFHLYAALERAKLHEENKEYKEALALYQKAAKIYEEPKAYVKLAKYYKQDIGELKANLEESKKFRDLAIGTGSIEFLLEEAQVQLNAKNYKLARRYFKAAADQGSSEAQFQFGKLHEIGYGGQPDLKLALTYYEFAAGQQHLDALFHLAKLNENLAQREKNNLQKATLQKKANQFYKDAHKQCLQLIQKDKAADLSRIYFMLGWIYQYGKGIAESLDVANSYYLKAAKNFYPGADSQLKIIKEIKSKNKNLKEEVTTLETKTTSNIKTEGDKKTSSKKKRNKNSKRKNQETESVNSIAVNYKNIYDTYIATNKYDEAIELLKKLLNANNESFLQANLLWSIAQCEKEKLFLLRKENKEKDFIQKQQDLAQKVYDDLLNYVNSALLRFEKNSDEFVKFQSIQNLAGYELEQIKPKTAIENIAKQANAKLQTKVKRNKKAISKKKTPTVTKQESVAISQPVALSKEEKPTTQLSSKRVELEIPLSKDIVDILNTLREAGASYFIHGGFVRDYYLNRPARDVDIVTSLPPEEIVKLFPNNSKIIGKRFPIVHITLPNKEVVEITTFRFDSQQNIFGNLQTDAKLRDLTINSVFYNYGEGVILAFNDAISDLDQEIIRFTNDPFENVQEDPVRILRAIRFAAELNFEIHKDSADAIKQYAYLLTKINSSRLDREMRKILQSPHANHSLSLMKDLNVLQFIFPQVTDYVTKYSDPTYESVLEKLCDKDSKQQIFTENYDLFIAALLSGPLKSYLFQSNQNRDLAINSLLFDFTSKISISYETYFSVKNILNDYLNLENKIVEISNHKAQTLSDLYQGCLDLNVKQTVLDKSVPTTSLIKLSIFADKVPMNDKEEVIENISSSPVMRKNS